MKRTAQRGGTHVGYLLIVPKTGNLNKYSEVYAYTSRCVEMWLESGDDVGDSVGGVASVGVGVGVGIGIGGGDGDGVVV